MVLLQCPHCDDEIELEDGFFGLFDCPHCENEFEWESPNGDEVGNFEPIGTESMNVHFKKAGTILALTVISMAGITFFIFLFNGESIGDSFGWMFFAAMITAAVWIPVSFIPSIIYLIWHYVKGRQDD